MTIAFVQLAQLAALTCAAPPFGNPGLELLRADIGFRLSKNAGGCGIAENVDPEHFGHPKTFVVAPIAIRSLSRGFLLGQNGKAIPAVASAVEALTRGVVVIVHAPRPIRIIAAANMLILRISTLLLIPIEIAAYSAAHRNSLLYRANVGRRVIWYRLCRPASVMNVTLPRGRPEIVDARYQITIKKKAARPAVKREIEEQWR